MQPTYSEDGERRGAAPSRRGALQWLSALLAAGIAGLLGVPVVGYALSPVLARRKDAGNWVTLGPADQFGEERVVHDLVYLRQDGWLPVRQRERLVIAKRGKNDFVVVSTVCPHAQCSVLWQPEKQQFLCPCHGGVFDADGQRIAGPPRGPLARLEARVNRNGQLEIRKA